jgi:hypothetical protein
MHDCLPYYLELFDQMKAETKATPVKAVAASPAG